MTWKYLQKWRNIAVSLRYCCILSVLPAIGHASSSEKLDMIKQKGELPGYMENLFLPFKIISFCFMLVWDVLKKLWASTRAWEEISFHRLYLGFLRWGSTRTLILTRRMGGLVVPPLFFSTMYTCNLEWDLHSIRRYTVLSFVIFGYQLASKQWL